uniref:BZIP domain-containing protein n=1 Tax=Lotus japonicus TaxID=34305 RepID=I3SLM2_LOTJA|nr:unknown [Lotus japonicus]
MASPPPPCNCWSHLTNSPPILLSGAADSAQAQPPLLISSNQRLQRQIRNRESSARSRAKKQACYNELEFKIAHVMEDNSRLRRQIEELQLRLKSSTNHSNMTTLDRTLTSPY